MKHELVRDWMTPDPITVTTNTTLPEVHNIMKSSEIRRLPVIDAKGVILGIVTFGDVREAKASPASTLSIWEMNYLLSNLKVKDFMTANPITVSPDRTVGEAARIMLENRVGGLPVVAAGQLVGIITESDIFSMVVLHEWEIEVVAEEVPVVA